MGLVHVFPCCAELRSPLPLPTLVGGCVCGDVAGERMEEFSPFVSDPPLFYPTAETAELEYFKIFAQLATKCEGFFGENGSFLLQPDQALPANDEASQHTEALLMAVS